MTLGQFIKKERTKKKLTLRQLSELSGVTFAAIALIEKDKVQAKLVTVAKIFNNLGYDLKKLHDLKIL